jgi:hypothetical protein
MTKNVFYALAFMAFFLPAAAQAVEYSRVITDLPLMDSMTEKSDQAVSFDKPDGRILKTSAETNMSPEAVLTFYRSALPALGWELPEDAEPNSFAINYKRKEERLVVAAIPLQGKTIVSFSIIPNAYITDISEAAKKEYIEKNKAKQ